MLPSQLAQLHKPGRPGAGSKIHARPGKLELLYAWGTCARAGIEVPTCECIAGGWLVGYDFSDCNLAFLFFVDIFLRYAQGAYRGEVNIIYDRCLAIW